MDFLCLYFLEFFASLPEDVGSDEPPIACLNRIVVAADKPGFDCGQLQSAWGLRPTLPTCDIRLWGDAGWGHLTLSFLGVDSVSQWLTTLVATSTGSLLPFGTRLTSVEGTATNVIHMVDGVSFKEALQNHRGSRVKNLQDCTPKLVLLVRLHPSKLCHESPEGLSRRRTELKRLTLS